MKISQGFMYLLRINFSIKKQNLWANTASYVSAYYARILILY